MNVIDGNISSREDIKELWDCRNGSIRNPVRFPLIIFLKKSLKIILAAFLSFLPVPAVVVQIPV